MVQSDVYTIAGINVLLVSLSFLFFKEFKLLSFDSGFAKGIGLPVVLLDQFIMLLIVMAVVIGIQAVGVVLMAALLITPAVAARYWTEKLHVMVIVAGLFGALSGFIGTVVSTMANNLPTGPLIVLSATIIFVISIVFAPNRGMVAKIRLRHSARNDYKKTFTNQIVKEKSL